MEANSSLPVHDGVDTENVASAHDIHTVTVQESQATLGAQASWEEEAVSRLPPKAPAGPSPLRRPRIAQPIAIDSAHTDSAAPPAAEGGRGRSEAGPSQPHS